MLFEFLQRVFWKDNATSSKKVAKERLRLVLVHDRAGVSPRLMENLKEDLIRVISEYMEIDRDGIEVTLSNEADTVALVASIPIVRVKRIFTSQEASL